MNVMINHCFLVEASEDGKARDGFKDGLKLKVPADVDCPDAALPLVSNGLSV